MRQLVFDGAPSDKMYGVDIISHWDVGFEMYRDKGRFEARFIEADMLDDTNQALTQLLGEMDIISVSALLHQWDWAGQVRAARRIVKFSRPGVEALVVGHQIGNVTAKEMTMVGIKAPFYRHNAQSFARMWDQVGEETGTKWMTQARLLTWDDLGWDSTDVAWMMEGDCLIDFVVKRVE